LTTVLTATDAPQHSLSEGVPIPVTHTNHQHPHHWTQRLSAFRGFARQSSHSSFLFTGTPSHTQGL